MPASSANERRARAVRTFIKFDFAPHWSGRRSPRLAALARASDRAILAQWPREGDYHDSAFFNELP